MAVQNDFLPFAVGAGANVLTQAQYAALSAIANGYSSGVAQSSALNKTWRQSSIMAAVISSFIVAQTGQAAIDDGTTATLLANFTQAIVLASKQRVVLADTGAANAYAAANTVPLTALPTATGVAQTVQIAHANTGASTYAPDGLTAKPIYGLGGAALQGGELPANGIATLVSYVGPLLNGGNLCWVLYECIGGAQQVPTATASGHAVQFGQVAGVVGSVRNLKCNNTAAGTSLTFTADEVVVESALGGLRYCLANLNVTVASGTTGLGGLDTGTALAANSFYAVYAAIKNDGTKGAFLQLEPAGGAPSVYGGANLPANVIATGLIGVWPTNGSGQFIIGFQTDRDIEFVGIAVLSSSAVPTAYTSFSAAAAIPKSARTARGTFNYSSSITQNANIVCNVSSSAAGISPKGGGVNVSWGNTQGVAGAWSDVKMATPQTLYYLTAGAAGTLVISVNGYTF